MAAEWYELLSLLMRYVFAALGAVIVWRVYRWIRRDARQYDKDMRRLPDAGLVGEMVDLDSGEAYPLPREGMIGSSRGCDIRVKRRDVFGRHATFIFEDGRGLRVAPYRRHPLSLDGTELLGAAHALHGSVVGLGRCQMRVRLFAGLDVPHPSAFMRGADDERGEAPDYRTPPPYEQAWDDADDRTPAMMYPMNDARAQMQNTWSYAVPPPDPAAQAAGRYAPQPTYNNAPQNAPYPDAAYTAQATYNNASQNAPYPDAAYTSQATYNNAPQNAPYPDAAYTAQATYDNAPADRDEQDDEAPAYQSPMPARRRRRDRR